MNQPPADAYAPIDTVPDGLKWKPGTGPQGAARTVLYSMGWIYKLVRDRVTGNVDYFRLKDIGPAKSPAEKIDAEPRKQGQTRYRVGAHCWFIDAGRWFCCEVVERKQSPDRITIRPVTGWDADRQAPWPYGDLLEFPALPNTPMFARLRPLKARQR